LLTQLFDEQQRNYLLETGENLLNKLEAEGHDVKLAAENFVFMEGYLSFLKEQQK